MARPSTVSIQEAERLNRFWRAGVRFLIERGVLAQQFEAAIPSSEQWSRATVGVPFSQVLAGTREAAHDTVAMLRDFLEASPTVSTSDVDTALRAQGAPTYSEMRSRKWEALAKVA